MATYKKKYKVKKEKIEDSANDLEVGENFDESQSTTAEVFNTLDETANKSEQWIEKNSNWLLYGLVGVVAIILSVMAYNKFIRQPKQIEASNELAFPRKHFDDALLASGQKADSLFNLGLKGADGKYGFIDIADNFGGTNAGNLANYYAGISYLKMKKYQEAIDHLAKFDSDDELLGPTSLGAIGDAYADANEPGKALDFYEQAANKKDNEFTTPLFLLKAGQTAISLEKYSKAESFFERIEKDFPLSEQARDAKKYLNAAKYAE